MAQKLWFQPVYIYPDFLPVKTGMIRSNRVIACNTWIDFSEPIFVRMSQLLSATNFITDIIHYCNMLLLC